METGRWQRDSAAWNIGEVYAEDKERVMNDFLREARASSLHCGMCIPQGV